MNGESLAGMIIMCAVCFGCGALFFGIGAGASRMAKPMHFWSVSHIDPKSVDDIPEYNRKNGIMWKWYSLPYWLAGIASLFSLKYAWSIYVSLAFLLLACVPGLVILIVWYKRIEKQHIIKPHKVL